MSDDCKPSVEVLQAELRAERELRAEQKESSSKALELANETMKQHLHDLNDVRKSFVSRELHDRLEETVNDKIASVSRLVYIGVGIAITFSFMVGIASLIIELLNYLHR